MDSETERVLAMLGQTVATVIADLRVEVETLRQVFISQGVKEPRLNQIQQSVQKELLPKFTSEASEAMRERFFQLRKLQEGS
jgi:ribosome-associated toxin RatA of RatAB toxin-antitoxin module